MSFRNSVIGVTIITVSFFAVARLSVEAQSICRNNGECKATSGPITVPHGDYVFVHDPACGGKTDPAVNDILRVFLVENNPQLAAYAGPVLTGAINRFGHGLRNWVASQGGAIAEMLSPITQPSASCIVVPVKLPKGASLTGFALYWREVGGSWEETPYGGESNVQGWAWKKFSLEPVARETPHGLVYYTIFKNWASKHPRDARMDVYFTRPSYWIPLKSDPW
jgi:hypothetical protein